MRPLVWFDEQRGTWRWDVAQIAEYGHAADIADLLARKVAVLPTTTRDLLQVAACIGNQMPLVLLAAAQGSSEEETRRALQEAMATGLVIRARDRYAFAHDRVQQAAYALIPEERRSAMHLRTGRHLLRHLPRERWGEWIFEIATQLNLGRALIADPDERRQLAELNLQAGRKAYAAAAYASALAFFTTGETLLPNDGWSSHYELTYALKLERARCEWLCGNLEAATSIVPDLLQHARGRVHLAAVHAVQVRLFQAQGNVEEASRTALSAYSSLVGIDVPFHPTEADLLQVARRTLALLGNRAVEDLLGLPEIADPDLRATIALLSASLPSLYAADPNLHDLMSCHIVDLTLQHGLCAFSSHGCAAFGATVGRLFGDWEQAIRFGSTACRLVDRAQPFGDEAITYHVVGMFLYPWVYHLREAIPLLRKARRAPPNAATRIRPATRPRALLL